MHIRSLTLHNFRNYAERTFEFSPSVTYIVGANAQGKTNILEAIHFICTGKGIKDDKQEEMMKFDSTDSDVRAEFDDGTALRIHASNDERFQKTYFVNTAKKMLFTYIRHAPPVVLFTPELISIIDGGPSERRHYIDGILSKIDIQYQKNLRNYESGMRRRNKILEVGGDQIKLLENLSFWNEYLIKHAHYIVEKRAWFCETLNTSDKLHEHEFHISYVPHPISEERFQEYFLKETYQKRTLIGPQRDEFIMSIEKNGKPMDTKKYASRGEQRLALFWLILQQLKMYLRELKVSPILLLDDIFSELDDHNKTLITELIKTHQTIITTTEVIEQDGAEIIAL